MYTFVYTCITHRFRSLQQALRSSPRTLSFLSARYFAVTHGHVSLSLSVCVCVCVRQCVCVCMCVCQIRVVVPDGISEKFSSAVFLYSQCSGELTSEKFYQSGRRRVKMRMQRGLGKGCALWRRERGGGRERDTCPCVTAKYRALRKLRVRGDDGSACCNDRNRCGMHVYTNVYMYVHVYMYVCVYIYTCMFIPLHTYIRMYLLWR